MSAKRRAHHGEAQALLRQLVDQVPGKACIMWPFASNSGVGAVWYQERMQSAARVMCIMKHGPAPFPKAVARHLCNSGHLGCVNHAHLAWSSNSENQMDRVTVGTSNRGEQHGASKLTARRVIFIRKNAGRLTNAALAARFRVSPSTISAVIRRKRWDWL